MAHGTAIPTVTIPLSRPLVGREELAAVERVLVSGQLANGPEVARFEEEFASYCGAGFGVAVSSGTAALELGLRALGVGTIGAGPGAEVVVPSFTFVATANAVRMVGATPVFADVDPATLCVDVASVERVMTPATAAVIAVHLYGHPAPADELAVLCAQRGCALIEDASQALGARWRDQHVGCFGALGTFSFYPTKAMTTGEGGMITTADASIADRLRRLRNHGMGPLGEPVIVGSNLRMSEIAAAIGRVQLTRVEARNDARRANARAYDRALAGIVELPRTAAQAVHSVHQYTIQVDDRPRMIAALERAGVGYGLYYPRPCHELQAFATGATRLAHTERAAARVVSIPVRSDLSAAEREQVIAAVHEGAHG